MNYYPHHIGDYAKDTVHLSMLEHGAYRLMLDLYYTSEKPLPLDRARLFRLLRAHSEQEREAINCLLPEFFVESEDGWRHARCDAEIAKAAAKSEKARNSANHKWSKAIGGESTRSARLSAAREKGTHTAAEWGSLLAFCDSKCVKCGSREQICKDHIKPIYQGGDDSIENIQPLCSACNKSKSAQAHDFRPFGWQNVCGLNANASKGNANASESVCDGNAPNNQEPITKDIRPRGRTASCKRSIPDDWTPKPETVEKLSREFGLRVPEDVSRYVAAFRDACEAKEYRYADFDAAFRNCVRQDWPKFRANGGLSTRPRSIV